jgi:hypothetical protein
MGNVWGKDKPLKEILRENKRMINRAIRELDREKTGLEREEKKIIIEIKKAAKENQMQAVKIIAKVSILAVAYECKWVFSGVCACGCGFVSILSKRTVYIIAGICPPLSFLLYMAVFSLIDKKGSGPDAAVHYEIH